MNTALVLAGGLGKRMETETPKQFLKLSGQPVLLHCIKDIKSSGVVDKIVLSLTKELEEWYYTHNPKSLKHLLKGLVDDYWYEDDQRVKKVVKYMAFHHVLDECNDVFIIHDAVRPLAGSKVFVDGVSKVLEHPVCAALPEQRIDESIVSVDKGVVLDTEDRNRIVKNQTPEFYRGAELRNAAIEILKNWNDEYETRGGVYWILDKFPNIPVKTIPGNPVNIKITYNHDLVIAERLYEYVNKNWRTKPIAGDETVLVIGSRSGIGSCIVKQLANTGVDIVTMDRPEFDASDPHSLSNQRIYGKYDACIYLPGILYGNRQDVYQVNLFTPQALIERAKFIVKPGGSFLVFGSSSAYRGRDDVPYDYSGSKAALINYVESYGPHLYSSTGVHLNCLCPRKTRTRMLTTLDDTIALDPNDVAEQAIKMVFSVDRFGEVYNMR